MLSCEPSCFVRIIIVHHSLCGWRRANIQGHNESSVMRCIHLTSNHHVANQAAWTPEFDGRCSGNTAAKKMGFWAFSIFFPCSDLDSAMSSSSSDASILSSPASYVLEVNGTRTNLAYHQHRSVPADRCSFLSSFEELDISRWNRDVYIII